MESKNGYISLSIFRERIMALLMTNALDTLEKIDTLDTLEKEVSVLVCVRVELTNLALRSSPFSS